MKTVNRVLFVVFACVFVGPWVFMLANLAHVRLACFMYDWWHQNMFWEGSFTGYLIKLITRNF